jgi:hypothetical protein
MENEKLISAIVAQLSIDGDFARALADRLMRALSERSPAPEGAILGWPPINKDAPPTPDGARRPQQSVTPGPIRGGARRPGFERP